MNRREFLKLTGSAAIVIGFDPFARRWITTPEAGGCSFVGAPSLDGDLRLDAASTTAVSTDQGNMIHHTPCAVLRPGSVADISRMIQYCRTNGIIVSTRGHGHTTYGQGLSNGLVIENMSLAKIHTIGQHSAVVDTGVTWRDLVEAAYAEGLTPPALTGYVQLTIGGTLSVGGIGGLVGSRNTGMQIDHARELEVVTGAGDVLSCSEGSNQDLFEVMLGGLGQCGVMTKATIDLIPAKQRARTYLFHYTNNRRFFSDFRTLLERDGLDHVYTLWSPPGTTSRVYELWATVFYDLAEPPDDLALTSGLSAPPTGVLDLSYLQYVEQIDEVVRVFQLTLDWDRLIKPWFDVWLPDSRVEQYVGKVVPTLRHRDIGEAGFLLIFAQRRSLVTRPFLRVPEPDGSDWIFLFDILTCSGRPGPNPVFEKEMKDRNNRLFRLARANYGGVRYPIGTMDFTHQDWEQHYGPMWPVFVSRKQQFDPDGILTPGPGIFP
jgi:cytokinin dehydrogenase